MTTRLTPPADQQRKALNHLVDAKGGNDFNYHIFSYCLRAQASSLHLDEQYRCQKTFGVMGFPQAPQVGLGVISPPYVRYRMLTHVVASSTESI